jgi:hypothetical protein
LKIADILVELIRDNRKILEKITLDQIDSFITQFQLTKVSEYDKTDYLVKNENICHAFQLYERPLKNFLI